MENTEKTKEQLLAEVAVLKNRVKTLQKLLEDKQGERQETKPKDTNIHVETNRNLVLRRETVDYDTMIKELQQKDISLKIKSEVILNYSSKLESIQGELAEKIEKLNIEIVFSQKG